MRDEDFIKSLSEGLEARTPIETSKTALLVWIVVSFAALIFGSFFHTIRRDASAMLESTSYYVELCAALAIGIIAAGNALHLRIPGARASWKVLAALLVLWVGGTVVHGVTAVEIPPFTGREALNCFLNVLGLALVPGVALFLFVRLGRSTSPRESLALVGMAMAAMAAAFIPLVCANDGAVHMLLGHVLPLFVLGGIFSRLGPSLLRW